MGDSSETLLELRNRRDDEEFARDRLIGGQILNLDEDSFRWILTHIDCFVSQSRGNESVQEVNLFPCTFDVHADEVLDKVGQAIGNLQALGRFRFYTPYPEDEADGDEVEPILHLEILARILRRVRQRIALSVDSLSSGWHAEDIRSFARAVHGHPTITCFDNSSGMFPYEASDALYSALATLPALEPVSLSSPPDDGMTLANPESLTELLRVPSLRSVCFGEFYFTRALCQATTNALTEGTAVTKLKFSGCAPAEECAAVLASCLSRNTSLVSIDVQGDLDVALYSALATALPSNSTLRDLSFVASSALG
jgi:hypothetical protein